MEIGSMDATTNDDVELRLIDPERNRFRLYGMTRCSTLFGEPCLVVAWGRIGQPLRRRSETFADGAALERRRDALLARRRRRGYAVTLPAATQSASAT
jgi:predicted DNA-binding WGR domain protein